MAKIMLNTPDNTTADSGSDNETPTVTNEPGKTTNAVDSSMADSLPQWNIEPPVVAVRRKARVL